MRPFLQFVLFISIISSSAAAQDALVPEGTCETVVSTHSSKASAITAARQISYRPSSALRIFETSRGEFKVSAGNLRNAEVPMVLRELILGGEAPDAECVSGDDFVVVFDARGISLAGASSEPQQCYFVVASRQTNAEVAQFIDETPSIDASEFEIFRANNGWYAITLGLVDENSFESTKQSLDVPSDSFCTVGSEFTRAPHVCMRSPITCDEGYTVQYDSCEAQNAIGSLGIEFDSGFCKMPQSFARETLVVDGFIGLEEDGQIYSFAAETSSEEFVVKISHAERNVQFFWQEYVPQTNRVSPNSSTNRPGFFGTWFNNMFSYSGGSGGASNLRYGCKFYCGGAFGTARSDEITVNTPHSDYAAAQDYVRREYEGFCEGNFGFHGGQSRGANVSFPSCETYYYED